MDEKENPYASPKSELSDAGQAWVRDHTGQMKLVYIGLSLTYWGIVCVLLAVIAATVGTFALTTPGGAYGGAILWAYMVLGFLGLLLTFIGPFFCLAVPAESEAKVFIIISVVLQLSNFIISPVLVIVDVPMFSKFAASMAGPLVGFAGILAFVFFMQRLAHFIGHAQLVRQANRVLFGASLVFVSWMALIVIAMGVAPKAASVLAIFVTLATLLVFVLYANLINELRKQLKNESKPEQPPAAEPSPKG